MTEQSCCGSIEDLERLARGAPGLVELEQHVASCPTCRDRLDELRANERLFEELRDAAGRGVIRKGAIDEVPGYRIEEEIHRGGQGTVFVAVQESTGRRVALKTLLQGRNATSRQKRRFEREVELIAGLRHPNLVTLYDSGETASGCQYFAMELVDGDRLDSYLERAWREDRPGHAKRPGRDDTIALFLKICGAVAYAHRQGVIHRDLKPANVLVDRVGEPRVLDFGLAKEIEPTAASAGSLTRAGEFMGSLGWAAPEQFEAIERVDTRTDVHALGVILYFMLSGRMPHDLSGTMVEVANRIMKARPASLRRQGGRYRIGDELQTIVHKCLEKHPEDRYQSAEALRDDLQRCKDGLPITAKGDSGFYMLRKSLSRHRWLAAGFLAVLAAGIGAFSFREVRAAEQAQQLAVGNLRLGRILARTPQVARAEDLIWGEHLRGVLPTDPEALEEGLSGPSLSHWALRELYASNPCLGSRQSPGGRIDHLGFTVDGSVLLGCSIGSSEILLWNLPDLGARKSVQASSVVRGFTVASDGSLAVMSDEPVIQLFDLAGRELGRIQLGARPTALSASPREPWLAVGDVDGRVHLHDLTDGALLWSSDTGDTLCRDLAFCPDGELLVSVTGTRVLIKEAATGVDRAEANREVDDLARVAISKKGELLFAMDQSMELGNGIRIWKKNGEDYLEHRYLKSDLEQRTIFEIHPTGDALVSASGAMDSLKKWSISGAVETRFTGHRGPVSALAISRDGRYVASGDQTGAIKLWTQGDSTRTPLRSRSGVETIHGLCVSDDGSRVALAMGASRRIEVWDLGDGRLVASRAVGSRLVSCVDFVPGCSDRLAVGDFDGGIYLVDLEDPAPPRELGKQSRKVSSLRFHPDGQLLATTGEDGKARLWSMGDGSNRVVFDEATRFGLSCLCWSPDGDWLVCGSRSGALHRVRLDGSGSELQGTDGAKIHAVAVSPDGDWIAIGRNDRSVGLLHTTSGMFRSLSEPEHFSEVFAVGFNHDGTLLCSADNNGVASIWDVGTGEHLLQLNGHERGIFAVAFTPDRRLVSAGAAEEAFVWDLTGLDRFIAGNFEYQLSIRGSHPESHDAMRRWARGVLGR